MLSLPKVVVPGLARVLAGLSPNGHAEGCPEDWAVFLGVLEAAPVAERPVILRRELDKRGFSAANRDAAHKAILALKPDAGASAAPATFTAAALMRKHFEPVRWAVPGLIPYGASLLCGKPKLGKSAAALNIALAMASGGRALGSIAVERGGSPLLGPRR